MNHKINLRIPRASNLVDLKLLLINSQEKQKISELLSIEKFKKENYLEEYLKLLRLLGFIQEDKYLFLLTNKGKDIKFKISKTSELTEDDKKILKEEFSQLDIVKIFLKNVFYFDVHKNNFPNEECLTKEDIKGRYLKYRELNDAVAERESRIIYNWLLGLELIEPLQILDNKNKGFNVCYHIIGKDLDFDEFSKKIKSTIFNALKDNRQKSEWVEIPKVGNLFCIQNNISKKQFKKFFIEYVIKNPLNLQLSTGSLLRKEVEIEGIEMNNKLYFYVKLT
ncbi:MAG: hypothetical protein WCE94_13775 [Candidatus Methanoperedens sp.]